MRNEEEATRITSGNFTYNLYKGYYEGETFAAEIMPGWDIYDGSFDLFSIFPDGKIEIPSSVEYDGMTYKVVAISEFRWIRQMTEFIIPPTVKILRHESLEGAPIENIILPDGVTNIEYGAFRNCNNLKTVYCGKNLENVSGNAFQGCSSLDKFEIDPKNPYLETIRLLRTREKESCDSIGNRVSRRRSVPLGRRSGDSDYERRSESHKPICLHGMSQHKGNHTAFHSRVYRMGSILRHSNREAYCA